MVTCYLCNTNFDNITKLVSHLSHPKSSCKCNIKDYYDKFIRKNNEGMCIYCGNETAFYGIVKGYINNKCKYCRNKGKETQEKRKKKFKTKKEYKKQKNGYYELSTICEICKKRFKNLTSLSKHLIVHKEITVKEYYDKYLKKENEGICPITKKPTNFKNINEGYYKFFGRGTCSLSQNIKEKKSETLFKNFNVTNANKANEDKRIKNYKETIKSKKRITEKRNELITILKKLTVNKNDKLHCQICGEKFNNFRNITSHIAKKHKVQIKKYYDYYFKQDGEDRCPLSNLETNFNNLQDGYFKYHKSVITYTTEIKNGAKNFQLSYIKQKIAEKQKDYNVEAIDLNSINYISDLVEFKCCLCNNLYKTRFTYLINGFGKCPKCFPRNTHKSVAEIELFDFIKENYNGEIYASYNNLIKNENNKKLEIDIYIPEKKFAIEYNGLYWHSECILDDPINYHLYKTIECSKMNLRLIHIFEDEWRDKKEILKKMLLHKLNISNKNKIYARNCFVEQIDSKTKNVFLENNHIQGKDFSRIKLGLFTKSDKKLVSVMTFSGKNLAKGTINISDNEWELSRFATDLNYIILGAAGKLLNYFKNNFTWSSIFSYADLRYSDGNLYYKLGFKKINQTLPNYWYVNNKGERFHRFNLRKKPYEPVEIPEWKLRHEQGYYRIWDCGHLKFELNN